MGTKRLSNHERTYREWLKTQPEPIRQEIITSRLRDERKPREQLRAEREFAGDHKAVAESKRKENERRRKYRNSKLPIASRLTLTPRQTQPGEPSERLVPESITARELDDGTVIRARDPLDHEIVDAEHVER